MRFPKVNILGIATFVAIILLWEVLVRSGVLAFEYLPAPFGIFAAWFDLLMSGEMVQQTLHTFVAVALGWCIAAALGVGLGLLLGLSQAARDWSLTSLEVLRPLPAIAFLPVSLLLFNFSLTTEVVLIVYASVWPAFINTLGGIRGIPPQLHDVSRSLHLSPRQALTKVVLLAAAPAIVTGCRLSMGLTLVMAIIAEMLANPEGLGYAVVSELQAMQPQRMFAYVLYIGSLAILMNAVLTKLSRMILHSHPGLRDSDA